MMKLLKLYEDDTLLAAATLRDSTLPCEGSLALHSGDTPQEVMKNREALCRELGVSLTQWCLANQTHSAHCQRVTMHEGGRGAFCVQDAIQDCDALYSDDPLLIGVFTADCVPLLLHDSSSGFIGAIHSGWPGSVKQITYHTLAKLKQEGLCPQTTRVWIAPCIHRASFQIRQDVIDQIAALPFDTAPYLTMQADGSALCDNVGLNVHMLLAHGIQREHITISPYDTYQEEDMCFSYRRNHTTHRHFSFLYRKR